MDLSPERKRKLFVFKQWSRKRISILLSLKGVVKIGVLCFAYSMLNQSQDLLAQTDSVHSLKAIELEEVQVSGRRSQVVSSEISRVVTVIHRDEIEKSGVQNIMDLLEFVSNVDMRQRGNYGIQSDVSIRGSSFDHVMILVNGVNMSDPQTGHLSLDLPLDPENIERVEVLEGTVSRTLGPGAFAGAINIVTLSGDLKQISASETYGAHMLRKDHIHAGIKAGKTDHFLSLSHLRSDGYMHNTDFKIYNAYYRTNFQWKPVKFDLQAGYQNKKFGAGGFYSARFPDQFEENSTWFASLKATGGKRVLLTPQIYWRRKKDHFLLIRDNPGFYENFHLTDVLGGQISSSYRSDHSAASIGLDVRYENIWSNNLGNIADHARRVYNTDSAYYTRQYDRTNVALFFEYYLEFRKLAITSGIMFSKNSAFQSAPFFFPGIDVSFRLSQSLSIFTSANRALHVPTFTDLFYTDPQHEGNRVLSANTISSFEAGMKYRTNITLIRYAIFVNKGKNITDWLWSYQTNKFSPVDLDRFQSTGISVTFQLETPESSALSAFFGSIQMNYIYVNVNKSVADSVSKYYNLKHKLSILLLQKIFKNGNLGWKISYQDRYGEAMAYDDLAKAYLSVPYHPFWLLDVNARWSLRNVIIFAELSNVLDKKYIDAGSALQEGRNLKAGFTVNFNFRNKK